MARHGIKESAKLKRIEAMDKRLLLESTAKNTGEKMEDHNITTKNNVKSKMKKKKKKSKEHQEWFQNQTAIQTCLQTWKYIGFYTS